MSASLSLACPGPTPAGKRAPTPTGHPLSSRRARAGPRAPAGRLLRGRPPGSVLRGCEGAKAGKRPNLRAAPAAQLGTRPPAAPRPGTSFGPPPPPHCLQPSSSETASEAVYASFAAVAKRMSARGRLRSRTPALAGRPGSGMQRLSQQGPRGRCGGARGWAGRRQQTSRAAPPPPSLRRLSGRAHQCGFADSRSPASWCGGAGVGGRSDRPGEKQPRGAEFHLGTNFRVRTELGRPSSVVREARREPSGFSERPMCPAPSTSS